MAGNESEEQRQALDAEVPAPSATGLDIDDVIARLDIPQGKLPKEAIRDAQRLGPQIIPRLVELIERGAEAIRNGEKVSTEGAFFALYLLTELKAKEALPAILSTAYLPDDTDLFGDTITAHLHRILAVLAVDDPEVVTKFVDDREADMYARWTAANTYGLWVRDGLMTREAAVEKLRQHLIKAMSGDRSEDYEFIAGLVCALCDLGAVEAKNEIQEAFQRRLVEEGIVDEGTVESELADPEETFRQHQATCPPSGIADTVEELSGWYGLSTRERFGLPELEPEPVSPAPRPVELSSPRPEPPPSRPVTIRDQKPHVGRNDPCPCGSGKKYKKCCGAKGG